MKYIVKLVTSRYEYWKRGERYTLLNQTQHYDFKNYNEAFDYAIGKLLLLNELEYLYEADIYIYSICDVRDIFKANIHKDSVRKIYGNVKGVV